MFFSPVELHRRYRFSIAIGAAALGKTRVRTEVPFAMIPVLFGIQQLIEGVIWLTFMYEAPLLKEVTTYLYSGFSHVLWPIFVPFAMGMIEEVRWRKKVIFAFGVAGLAVGFYLLYYIVVTPMVAEVVGSHIVYDSPHFYLIPVMFLYLVATCVSCFFSSHGFVKLFGSLMLLSFIAAYIVHVTALVSIWCFFAAILSLLIYIHLRFRDLGGSQRMNQSRRDTHRCDFRRKTMTKIVLAKDGSEPRNAVAHAIAHGPFAVDTHVRIDSDYGRTPQISRLEQNARKRIRRHRRVMRATNTTRLVGDRGDLI